MSCQAQLTSASTLEIPPAPTPPLRELFTDLKQSVTSSRASSLRPFQTRLPQNRLERFDRSKPVFLKTEWSACDFAMILMQPSNSPESKAVITKLLDTGILMLLSMSCQA